MFAERAEALLAAERRARIIDQVASRGSARVKELAELFSISEVTVRKDLDRLAQQGFLVRTRGGAMANSHVSLPIAFSERASLNQEEKRRIGRAAADLVHSGDTIFLDAGSTVMELAKNLRSISPLNIVTNALNAAALVGTARDARILVIGGSFSSDTLSTFGPNAVRELNELLVDKVFLGAHAFALEAGVTDLSIEIAQMKQAMIKAGRQVILLADSSKWSKTAFVRVVPLSGLHTIVSDTGLEAEAREAIQRLGIHLILA